VSEQKTKILVMDDEEIVADIAKQMLEYLGYEVCVVENGEEAIEEYRESHSGGMPYSLVIMDLNIPGGMGGMEAVKGVLDVDESAKVIVATGFSTDPIVNDYKDYGFSGCIAKPFDLKGLQDVVNHVL